MARKKKEDKQIEKKTPVAQDLFKYVSDLLGRDLTESESEILAESARVFVSEELPPNQVYDKDILKEIALSMEYVTKEDFEEDDKDVFEEEDGDESFGKLFCRYGCDEMGND